MKPESLLTAADAARILGVTPAAVRQMQKRGDLVETLRTAGGVHLYRLSIVQRLADEREQRRKTGGR